MRVLPRRAWLGALVFACGATPAAAQAGFQRAWQLVAEARFAEALEAARAETDPLWRDRALLLVRHHAGDLRGALAAGLGGLERRPGDAWLLEQGAYVAVSLHESDLAAELARRLAGVANGDALAPEERERYRVRAAELAAEADELQRLEDARERAMWAARWTVAGVLGLALALLAWLALVPVPQAKE